MSGLTPPSFWFKTESLSAKLLSPLAYVFRNLVALRRKLYKKKWLRSQLFPIPVIVVGNILVGGTGKTPLTIFLANCLYAAGYTPGIVSRGYGGKGLTYPHLVKVTDDPHAVGDEAIVIKKNTPCPVMIAPKRTQAIQHLIDEENCNVIVSDDGLQHYRMARDIEIIVLDVERGIGNGKCLPAGPLREPAKRLSEADFIIGNGGTLRVGLTMNLVGTQFRNVANPWQTRELRSFKGQVVHGVAGIGHPARFFRQLSKFGLEVIQHPYPDHYYFQPQDICCGPDEVVIMTEKDAVKCRAFADERHWYLAVELEIAEEFEEALFDLLRQKIINLEERYADE